MEKVHLNRIIIPKLIRDEAKIENGKYYYLIFKSSTNVSLSDKTKRKIIFKKD